MRYMIVHPIAKTLRIITLFFLAIWFNVTPIQAFEEISQFHSDITVNRNTSIKIVETIRYTTSEEKHGIYRYIPTRYSRNGLNYTARVHSIRIYDDRKENIPYEQSWESGNVVLKIGDADKTFVGPKVYVIEYEVDNAIQLPDNQEVSRALPELYWDITGEGWRVDIASSSATVYSPGLNVSQLECYSGPVGSDNGLCQVKQVTPTESDFAYARTITYGDNMTVAVQFSDSAAFDFPTPTEKALKQLQDNAQLLWLLIPGIVMSVWWWLRGRDTEFTSWNVFNHTESEPQQKKPLWSFRPIPMVYEPIKELTPGEAGAVHDEKVDNEDVIAEIIDLARQKFLKIERLETKKFFFIPDTDYVFTKLKEANGKLPKQQEYLLRHIFSTGDVVNLSDLKGSFYTHMDKVKKYISQSLHAKGLFLDDPHDARGIGLGVAIMLLIFAGIWGIQLLTIGLYWALPVFCLSGIVAIIAGYNLPTKTAKGSNFSWQVRGLRRSIQYGAWREKLKEKDLFFEEVLPFAIALGVVDKLVRDMKDLNVPEPSYIHSPGTGYWSTNSFIHSFSSQAASSLSYNPSSSSYSSGSGFSGGSSGGGGGGGGGGSW